MDNNPTKSPKTITILDVGTGEGDSYVLLSREAASVVSLDCDLEMLKKGMKKKKILKDMPYSLTQDIFLSKIVHLIWFLQDTCCIALKLVWNACER